MADLNLQGYRVKAIPQAPLNVELISSGVDYDDTLDTAVEYIRLENVAPIPATIAIPGDVTTTLGNSIITGSFSSYDLRVGDGIAGTNIAFGSKIAAITNSTTVVLDQNCTNTVNDIVVTPPTFNSNIFALTKNFTMSGSVLTMKVKVMRATGKESNDVNADGQDDSTYLEYLTYIDQVIQIDLDTYLTNLRVSRT